MAEKIAKKMAKKPAKAQPVVTMSDVKSGGRGKTLAESVLSQHARLSDPGVKKNVAKTVKTLSKDKDAAREFLKRIGVATPTGRLSKRYGG